LHVAFSARSIIVRFDADGNLITPTDGLYTPKGNVRLNFVDHGKNFADHITGHFRIVSY
jgi:hypothetical protein